MESLPKHLRRKIALDLSPKDLIELCLSSKDVFYKEICGDNEFWRLKLFHDYPETRSYFKDLIAINPKNTYMRLFARVAKNIEGIYSIKKEPFYYISDPKTRKEVFDYMYKLYNEIRKNIPFKDRNDLRDFLKKLVEKNPFDKNINYPRYLESSKAIRDDLDNIVHYSPLTKYVALFENP